MARAGNPLLAWDLFVGRDRHLAELADMLGSGQSALLIGGRRTGKSTLARNLATANLGRTVVITDAHGWDLTSERAALGALRGAIEGRAETTYRTAGRDEIAALLQRARPLTVVVDEADYLLQTTWCGSFFSFLRYLDDTLLRSEISILLIGGPVLLYFRDPDDRGSPPLNTAEPTFIDPLDHDAVRALVDMAGAGAKVDFEELMTVGGGHAFLTTRLLANMWNGASLTEACDRVAEASPAVFEVWERQLGPRGRELLSALPPGGVPMADVRRSPAWTRFRATHRIVRAVGAARVEHDRLLPGPQIFVDWLLDRGADPLTWDLAVSYASVDEPVARSIADQLKSEFKVFFAPDEAGPLWGTDLERVLPNTYGVQSRLVLVLCTAAYVNRHWTLVEYQSVSTRRPDRILLVEMGALPPDLPSGLVYRGSTTAELVGLVAAIRAKLQTLDQR